jgi:hypothetical protein
MKQLLEAIKHLSPADRRELQRQVLAWQDENGEAVEHEAELLRAAQARLPSADERRLRRLITKSEQGTLSPEELADYRRLAQQAEQLDVTRAEALAELARRRGQAAPSGRKESGREGVGDGA